MTDRMPVFSEEWGNRFMQQMDEYMGRLQDSLDHDDEEFETISGQPFDGCRDCWEREAYLMAVKLALEGHEAGQVRLVEV